MLPVYCNKQLSLTLLLLLLAIYCLTINGVQGQRTPVREQDDQKDLLVDGPVDSLRSRYNNRLLAVPYSLARFLSYNSRGGSNGAAGSITSSAAVEPSQQINGYKRSGSSLDSLSGITFGKRSANPMEFVNFEPIFGRQGYARGSPRVYDLRWAPFDSIETPSSLVEYNN